MINLLPPEEKENILKEKTRKIVLNLGILGLISFFVLALTLLLIKTEMKTQLSIQNLVLRQKEKEFEASRLQKLEEELKTLNSYLLEVEPFLRGKKYLVDIIEEISGTLSPGMHLKTFSYQLTNQLVSISGYCPSRQTLLEFGNNLEANKNFKDFKFPPSNWLKPKDIEFFLNFSISK